MACDKFKDSARTVLPRLLLYLVRLRERHLHDVAVKLTGLGDLRLEVLELLWRHKDSDAIRVARRIPLVVPRVEAIDVDDFEGGIERQLLHPDRINVVAVQDACQDLQVLVQRAKHEQRLT